jgi:chloride channel protein, CIC family
LNEGTNAGRSTGVPIAPSIDPAVRAAGGVVGGRHIDLLRITALAVLLGIAAAIAAELLTALIGLITSLAFHGEWSTRLASPAGHGLGPAVVLVPVAGALIVGVMARFGSSAIRGHGIPEAMEQVLLNESRIPARITLLKPVSAAISIGTGGPFGAEGPIIATGGALGSLIGQALHTTADERKTLLASGAAAGMAATFGAPVSAVLLAIELLLFEYRVRSLLPVAFAASAAAAIRAILHGPDPIFPMAAVGVATGGAMLGYVVIGALCGLLAAGITRLLFRIEDFFETLPIHWMWWPALGAIVVGVVGFIEPATMGVGYDNIIGLLQGSLAGRALLALVALKLVSWIVALGSGTSGGTLAPLFTIGGGFGALVGAAAAAAAPGLGIDAGVAGLVGMAATFAGASHAVLASVVFAFETTREPLSLLPLLAGCAASLLVARSVMRTSIMTEKLARRGTHVDIDYAIDYLAQVPVRDVLSPDPTILRDDEFVEEVRDRMAAGDARFDHHGFPVLDEGDRLMGVVTRRDLLAFDVPMTARVRDLVRRSPVTCFPEDSARAAADVMVRARVGRLVVVSPAKPHDVVGILTRSDLLEAHERRLRAREHRERTLGRKQLD